MDHARIHGFIGLVGATAVLAMLACNLPLPDLVSPQPSAVSPPSTEPTLVSAMPAPEPIVVTHTLPDFRLYSTDGTLLETRSAEGLEWARPNTAQVVGEDIFYVYNAGPDQAEVVRRVSAGGSMDLAFTQTEDVGSLTFAVSADGSKIAWASTIWGGSAPVSRLWAAGISGDNVTLVAETDSNDDIDEWFVLEPVEWLADGDLVYAWQVTGIGGYILFYGWSSLYRYTPASGTVTPIAPVQPEVGAPCWDDVTFEGSYAVGACGPSAGVYEVEVASGAETQMPGLPDQGQSGAAAYSTSGERLAYAIARGDPENEAGQVVVRGRRGEVPVSIASLSPGYFERMIWIDEQRMAVGSFQGEAAQVELVVLDGARSPIGEGRLIGVMRPAVTAACEGIAEQVERGELELKDVNATGDLTGPGMTVLVHNPGTEDVETCIPCGTVFEPAAGDAQGLMAVQQASATVPAGGDASLTAFVICIEAREEVPDKGAQYTFGSTAGGNLGAFAQCVCGEDLGASLNPLDPMSVLFAGWMISEGMSYGEMIGGDEVGALGDVLGSEASGALAGIIDVIEGPAQAWLDKCGIEP